MATKSTAAERAPAAAEPGTLALVCIAAWAVPGAAHLWLGRRQQGIVFLVVLTAMFVIGLMFGGQIAPFEFREPLVGLMALADFGVGVPWILAKVLGYGAGEVTAVTHEAGNTFLIVAGLLNALIVLDAFDIAMGRK